jgi:PmbA protein
MTESLVDIGQFIVNTSTTLGAGEVTAWVSRGTSTEVSQREGRIEKWQDSRSRSVSAALLVEDRYSVHTTNDLRPEALRAFLSRAIQATELLEPDKDRRLCDIDEMGTVDAATLDLSDGGPRTEIDYREWLNEIEGATLAAVGDGLRSANAFVWTGSSERAMVTSNGFRGGYATTDYGHGATVSIEDEGGRIPEAYGWHTARHRADLQPIEHVAQDAAVRAHRRLGSRPVPSRTGLMLVDHRVVGRLLSAVLAPLSGANLFERRSCLMDRLDETIGASGFCLVDDPHLPRGLGSRPYDGDGRPTRRRSIVETGVLRAWLLDVYHARRLGRPPTVGRTSNLVIPPGSRTPTQIAAEHDWVLRVEGFLGGNSNPATGRFSYGIQGTLLSHGEPVAAVSEMNISGTVFELLAGFVEAANDPWTGSTCRSPSLLFDAVQFSGS